MDKVGSKFKDEKFNRQWRKEANMTGEANKQGMKMKILSLKLNGCTLLQQWPITHQSHHHQEKWLT